MDGKNIFVLIVDDEERFRNTTAAILKKQGFDVKAVGSGLEAIQEVKKEKIDVVILDIEMPGMKGNEALREIKKIKPKIEVIMLTGHGTPETAKDGLQDGVFDYLTKPCAIDVLAKKIHEAHAKEKGVSKREAVVKDIMVPLSSFSSIRDDHKIFDVMKIILDSFTKIMTTSTLQEMVHRSILVMDKNNDVVGIITFTDLMRGLQPEYMSLLSHRIALADKINIEAPNFSGMFTIMVRDLAQKTVRDIMSDAPPIIDAQTNLMAATNEFLKQNLRRFLVRDNDKIIGVIREQDMFFEMSRIMFRDKPESL